ncbi:uncharacterized protein SPPG_05093 [Spizellomyces punctatus DAOM BR117]|uniref:C2H2-type domain-containing protein n=1 Tax=Spizellomyces punctatus (strain DAOM BR117) TaxID=645134 RepID=A0A0L0HF95_SPIPD|nr:uncharacterized protein SPPG_05093 [Spizellomyces punctatus DAOM BR117]KNC99711.1 hypothetical protein SPPG_05093 [Spizellomyces punctatus DAOM BR117]|eukprot:XP_016607751.1 hypothetical protein SPPG_05093 [Spizellomyces punctatus DAOM BR117]
MVSARPSTSSHHQLPADYLDAINSAVESDTKKDYMHALKKLVKYWEENWEEYWPSSDDGSTENITKFFKTIGDKYIVPQNQRNPEKPSKRGDDPKTANKKFTVDELVELLKNANEVKRPLCGSSYNTNSALNKFISRFTSGKVEEDKIKEFDMRLTNTSQRFVEMSLKLRCEYGKTLPARSENGNQQSEYGTYCRKLATLYEAFGELIVSVKKLHKQTRLFRTDYRVLDKVIGRKEEILQHRDNNGSSEEHHDNNGSPEEHQDNNGPSEDVPQHDNNGPSEDRDNNGPSEDRDNNGSSEVDVPQHDNNGSSEDVPQHDNNGSSEEHQDNNGSSEDVPQHDNNGSSEEGTNRKAPQQPSTGTKRKAPLKRQDKPSKKSSTYKIPFGRVLECNLCKEGFSTHGRFQTHMLKKHSVATCDTDFPTYEKEDSITMEMVAYENGDLIETAL